MFKFIHAADIHLDSPLVGLDSRAPFEQLRGACRRAFENLVELALKEKINFLLLAGDLYDGDNPDYQTTLFLRKQLNKLATHDIQVFLIAGNHDAANRELSKGLHNIKNLHVFQTSHSESVVLEDLAVAIHAQGFKSRHVEENLVLNYPQAESRAYNIGLLHSSLDGREGHGVYAPCKLEDLQRKDYQYWALGHIHQQEIVSQFDPWVVFSGCIQGRHIRETGKKGCFLVEVDERQQSHLKFCELCVWLWHESCIDISETAALDEVAELCREHFKKLLANNGGKPIALRLTLKGRCHYIEQLTRNLAELRERMQEIAHEVTPENSGELWLEQLVNHCCTERVSSKSEESEITFLLQQLRQAELDEQSLKREECARVLRQFMQRLPDGLRGFAEDELLKTLLVEAQRELAARLVEGSYEN